jgi:hypothetical protein
MAAHDAYAAAPDPEVVRQRYDHRVVGLPLVRRRRHRHAIPAVGKTFDAGPARTRRYVNGDTQGHEGCGRRPDQASAAAPASGGSASASASARCSARRPVPWAICWRHDVPDATSSVSAGAARTALNSTRSPIAIETS